MTETVATAAAVDQTTGPIDRRCLHDLVVAAAREHPGRAAIVVGDERITYRELLVRARRMAGELRAAGVDRPAVGVLLPRTAEFVVAALAALFAGGYYVPLDPDYPVERLRLMLTTAGCSVVVGTSALRERLPHGFDGRYLAVDDPAGARRGSGPTLPETHPDDLAYVMFTSGSTGTPKGVMITHRGVVRLVEPPGIVPVSAADVVLHLSSVSFDAATFDMWSALTAGATLAIAPAGRPSGRDVAELIRQHGATTVLLPTGLFHLMVDEQVSDLAGLCKLVVGGDVLSAGHARRFTAAVADCALVNAYGPTEVTVATTMHAVSRDHSDPVPIGAPMPNTSIRLLDDDLRPVPPGEVGQIYAGGRGLARGYVADPGLTAARFLPDPDVPGARVYATGDLARQRLDGAFEFLGRVDDQVKKRGFRVEPGEVEAALREDAAVRQAYVLADGASAETRRLVAVLTPADGPADAEFTDGVRGRLRDRVPEHLVPDLWTTVETVPLTLGGKPDRAELRRIATSARRVSAPAETAPDAGPEESALAAIWREVLDLEQVDADADFFELGGHSLLANKIVYQVRKRLGVDLPLYEVFDRPRFADLVAELERLSGGSGAGTGEVGE
ncbi:MAG: non-ribosomal peptide synthetase [Actinophytocola sp.]|uniref:non-ribosomal peptide synthetase n=1 Tax=Actinophytocola sp. TaxID=1872138 RepID=UPI003D6AF049